MHISLFFHKTWFLLVNERKYIKIGELPHEALVSRLLDIQQLHGKARAKVQEEPSSKHKDRYFVIDEIVDKFVRFF